MQSQTRIKIIKILASLFSGSILPFAFAPADLYPITLLSISILLICLVGSSPRQAFLYGYLFGLGMFGIGINWLHISINLFGGVNLAGALFFTYLLVAFISIYPALTAYIARKYFVTNESIQLLIIIPCLWIVLEWCRSWVLTGFPWLNLGYSQLDTPLAKLAPVSGIYGMSLGVMITSAVIVYIIIKPRIPAITALAITVLCWTVLFFMDDIDWTTPETDTLNIALIQGGIPQKEKWKPENRQYTRELYLELSRPYLTGDLIIWPETAIPSFLHNAADFIQPLQEIISQHHVDLLTGIPVKNNGDPRYYNSVISISDQSQRYDKRHLVPFGEYLPLPALLRPLFKFLEIPMSNFSPGNSGKPVLRVRDKTIGVSICYEDVFGEEVIDALPDAGILVNVSNDAWFGNSPAPHQHLQMSRLRALETGRYMLRATNTGISAIIDHRGKIVSRTKQFVADSISGEVLLFSGTTPYARWGNKIIIIPVLLLLVYLFIKNRKNRFGLNQD